MFVTDYHLLVQSPEQDSAEFKYYKDESNNKLVLKDGNDFPKDSVVTGMDYDMFTKVVLNIVTDFCKDLVEKSEFLVVNELKRLVGRKQHIIKFDFGIQIV